ncbi:hypothetical protein MTX78_01205 [Hymenobacter tibetensis]|uniref:SH3 domain-containing protein n=1 Tax=Hymenobacter tibetensis TaxID=497967 RepID=A0ABY4CY84_9BACT|nr:hypothetical protein [Hymenobacter tibetensis]UOG75229.1 hypothetical protein MTX78_01205 [Hymenobacter tibetensis]
MNRTLLLFFSLLGLAACTAAKENTSSTNTSKTPVAHNTIVDCVLYDGMTKESTQLTSVGSGVEVQVTDTVDVYFVKARVTKDGKTMNGYMYRTCFPQR